MYGSEKVKAHGVYNLVQQNNKRYSVRDSHILVVNIDILKR